VAVLSVYCVARTDRQAVYLRLFEGRGCLQAVRLLAPAATVVVWLPSKRTQRMQFSVLFMSIIFFATNILLRII
jgi:hypothetical protein